MKFIATINHTEVALESSRKFAGQMCRSYCAENSIDWLTAEIFIAHFPERGRYLQKSSGHNDFNAGG